MNKSILTKFSMTLILIICSNTYRRNLKFCSKCGTLGRVHNLTKSHFPYCQPHLGDGESGFLKVGQLPLREIEVFRMRIRMIGMPEKPIKPRKNTDTEDESSESESDDSDSHDESDNSISMNKDA